MNDAHSEIEYTYYILDAQGNQMGVYERVVNQQNQSVTFEHTEKYIYGSSRVGVLNCKTNLLGSAGTAPYSQTTWTHKIGERNYELSNHLGNVLSVISDKPVPYTSNSTTPDYYMADIIQSTDYSGFGVQLSGRNFVKSGAKESRYGFQGQELDNEIKGEGNSYDFGNRMLDSRLGRWFTIDHLANNYSSFSPYNFVINNPLIFIDPNGDIVKPVILNKTNPYDWSGKHTSIAWLPSGITTWGLTEPLGLSVSINHKKRKVKTTAEFNIYLSAMWSDDHKYNKQMHETFTVNGEDLFEKKETQTKLHEDKHVELKMQFINMQYSLTFKDYEQDQAYTYEGTPDEILQKAYDKIRSDILKISFNVKRYSDLTVTQKQQFNDIIEGDMNMMITELNMMIAAKMDMSKQEEEDITQSMTTFDEHETQALFIGITRVGELPYNQSQAEEMNNNPESAKIPTEPGQ